MVYSYKLGGEKLSLLYKLLSIFLKNEDYYFKSYITPGKM